MVMNVISPKDATFSRFHLSKCHPLKKWLPRDIPLEFPEGKKTRQI